MKGKGKRGTENEN